jgi:hypothetical protein
MLSFENCSRNNSHVLHEFYFIFIKELYQWLSIYVACILEPRHCSFVGKTNALKVFEPIFWFINYNRIRSEVQLV